MQKQNQALNEQSNEFIKRLKYINMINQPKQEYFNVVLSKIDQVKTIMQNQQINHKKFQNEHNQHIKIQNQQKQNLVQPTKNQNRMIPETNRQQETDSAFRNQKQRDLKAFQPQQTQQTIGNNQNIYLDIKKQIDRISQGEQKIEQRQLDSKLTQYDDRSEDILDSVQTCYMEFDQNQEKDLKPQNLANQFNQHQNLELVKKAQKIQSQKEQLEKDHKYQKQDTIKQHVKTQQEQLNRVSNISQPNKQLLKKNSQDFENAKSNKKQSQNQQQKDEWIDKEIEILTEVLGFLKIDTTQVDQFFQNLTKNFNKLAAQKGLQERSHQEILEKIKKDSFLIYKHEKQKEKKTYKHLIEKSLTSFI